MMCESWMPALPEWVLVTGILLSFAGTQSRAATHRSYPVVRMFLSLAILSGVIAALLYDSAGGLNLFRQGLGLDISLRTFAFGRLFGSDVCAKLLKLTLCSWTLVYMIGVSADLFGCRLEDQKMRLIPPELLLFFALLGGMLTLSAQDFRLLFIGTELVSLATLILLKMFERPSAGDGVFRVFVLNSVGAALILFGAALIGGLYGTTDFGALAAHFRMIPPSFYSPFLFLAFALITFGFFAKLRLFPFHGLAMEVAEGAERPLFPFLTFLPRFVFFAALLRVFGVLNAGRFCGIFLIFGVLGTFFAVFSLSRQNRIQPLLACLTLGQSGLLMIGFAVASTNVLPSLFFAMILHALAMLGVIGTLLWVQRQGPKIMTLDDLAFVKQRSSAAAVILGLSVLSLVGFPLSPGFVPFLVFVQNLVLERAVGAMVFVVLAKGVMFGTGVRMVRAMVAPCANKNPSEQGAPERFPVPWKEAVICGGMVTLVIAADRVLTYFSLVETTLEWYSQDTRHP